MKFKYKQIQKQCIEWYEKNHEEIPISKNDFMSPQYFNQFAEQINYKSKFNRFDIVKVNSGLDVFKENIFFITNPIFNPINQHINKKDLELGFWTYQGHVMEVKKGEVKHINTPARIFECQLEEIVKSKNPFSFLNF